MSDRSYTPKIYREQGGSGMTVATGGTLTVEGTLTIATSATVTNAGALSVSGTQTVAAGGGITFATGSKLVRSVLTATAGSTLGAEDSGLVVVANAADLTFVLPATAAGLEFTFILASGGLSSTTADGLAVSPVTADRIRGIGVTPADNKDLILFGTADRAGDMLKIVGDGAAGWVVVAAEGTWARES